MINIKDICLNIQGKSILRNVSTEFKAGHLNVLLGPNGSGKSSLLKIFSGALAPSSGQVLYNGRPLTLINTGELAKFRSVMSQSPELNFPFTVEEVVMMGRYPHFSMKPTVKDTRIVDHLIDKLQLADFRDRDYQTLSGGEKQRVHFARLLSQVEDVPNDITRYIFLDEPLNNLDIRYQHDFLTEIKRYCNSNTVVVAIVHDLNLALQFADQLFFLKQGKMVCTGEPLRMVTTSLIKEVFDVDTQLLQNPLTGRPVILY
jgi:iron complex transport system ATP-binding protein